MLPSLKQLACTQAAKELTFAMLPAQDKVEWRPEAPVLVDVCKTNVWWMMHRKAAAHGLATISATDQ